MVGTKVFNSQDVVTYCSDKVWVESLVFIVNDEGISCQLPPLSASHLKRGLEKALSGRS